MLQKQTLPINFAMGLDTKTDPWQVAPNNFLRLENQIFTKGGRLTKRNGYRHISTLPDSTSTSVATFNDNLTAIGAHIFAVNESASSWTTSANPYQSLELSTLPLIRNSLNQTQCDSAVLNGLVCTAYTETTGSVTSYKFVVADVVTGQNVYPPTAIPVGSGAVSGSPRVFALGNVFVIAFTNLISATSHLQYIAVKVNNASITVTANADLASAYTPSTGLSWDGVVVDDRLFIAYNTTSGGQAVKVTYLLSTQAAAGGAPATATTFSGYTATLMSTCADTTNATSPKIYLSFYNSGVTDAYTASVDFDLNVTMIPVRLYTGVTTANIVSAAQNGVCKVYYEITHAYAFDSSVPDNYIKLVTVTPSGLPVSFRSVFSSGAGTITASSATGLVNGMFLIDATTKANLAVATTFTIASTTLTLSANTTGNSASSPGDLMMAQAVTVTLQSNPIVLSVGLASKAFIVDSKIFFWTAHQSTYQPTYFLVNGGGDYNTPLIAAKIAYGNGGGYLTLGLPGVPVIDGVAYVAYLFKDLITPVNKTTNPPSGTQVAGVYSQTGINLCQFTVGTDNISTAEIGDSLLLSGGFLWMYDGVQPVEQNFFLYPENVEVTAQADPVPTGTLSNSVNPTIITGISSMTGITVGMTVTDTTNPATISASTTVIAVDVAGSKVTMSAPATASHVGDSLKFVGNLSAQQYYYQAIYQYTDNQGNIHRSAPSIPVTDTASAGHTSSVINIPNLNLTYKGNNVSIIIYRWSVAQPVYYQITSVSSPLVNTITGDYSTFIDIGTDASILGNSIIYTNGGVLENVNGPASSIFTLFDNRFWMVDSEDRDLLWFSKQVIENVPVEMSDALTFFVAPTQGAQGSTGHVSTLAPMDDKLIPFKPNAVYYVNGTGPDNTGANNQYSQAIFVTSTVGCENQRSVVFQPNGLMFQSEKGWWLLGRDLSTTYIGAPVEEFNTSTTQSAVSVPETNQVRFTLDTGETLMYDYFYSQWATFVGVPAISSCIYQGLHTFLNSFSAVYQEASGSYLDGGDPVLLGLTSAWFNLAGLQGYQRAYFFYLLGKYLTPHKLNVTVAYDYNPSPVQSSLITPTNFAGPYGGPDPNPGDGTDESDPLGQQSPLGGEGNVEQWRVFLTKQRCQAFQISIQEVYDASFGVAPGEGLTLSGINLVYGVKKGFRPMAARHSIGGGE